MMQNSTPPIVVPWAAAVPTPQRTSFSSTTADGPNSHDPKASTTAATLDDVIFGRGSGQSRHPGNIRFHAMIKNYLPFYKSAICRYDKTFIVQAIFESFRASGRFMVYSRDKGCFEASSDAAKSKIGHALRYQMKLRQNATPVVVAALPARQPRKRREASLPRESFRNCIITNQDLELVLGYPGEVILPDYIPPLEPLVEPLKPVNVTGESHLGSPDPFVPLNIL